MAEEMTPEQIAELQKKNCVFCKIISGEIESKKVFENEHFLAVLDIRPAAPGHLLLMPKEHVPILPLLPEERLQEVFQLSTQLADAMREALIVQRVTVFTASGWAAGQQAPHLIVHLIPREKGDNLDMLDLEKMDVPQADALALAPLFKQATTQALAHKKREDLVKGPVHKKEQGGGQQQPQGHEQAPPQRPQPPQPAQLPGEKAAERARKLNDEERRTKPVPHAEIPPSGEAPAALPGSTAIQHPQEDQLKDQRAQDEMDEQIEERGEADPKEIAEGEAAEFSSTNEALEAALNMSPDLRRLIIAQPDLVTDYVARSPKLAKLFEGVNIRALSLALQRQERPAAAERTAAQMSEQELFMFIDNNEGLRTWMLENPEELAARIPENPRLAAFFAGIEILPVAKRYREHHDRGGR